MEPKIAKKLVKIVKSLENNNFKLKVERDSNPAEAYNNLTATAYSWIYEKLLSDMTDDIDNPNISTQGIRIFSNEEKELLGLKNCGYLLNLFNLGLLNNSDIESIIEEIKFIKKENVSRNDINILILSLFLGVNSLTLPGSRLSLYLSDSVN